MYLEYIDIKNIGPISKLSIKMPFDKNNRPKPLILVGENGTGKTVMLSQIVDGLYEIGSQLFDDIAKYSNINRSYYKVLGGINLKLGEKNGFSILQFKDFNGNIIEYFDKIGNITHNDIEALNINFKLIPNDKMDSEKLSTVLEGDVKKQLLEEWRKNVHIYNPAYRYEEPFWKNDVFQDSYSFQNNKIYIDKYGKELEIISSTKKNKSFIIDLVLDFAISIINKNVEPQHCWISINNIVKEIKQREDILFGIGKIGERGRINIFKVDSSNKVTDVALRSIDDLSLGESVLLNMFVNIIRHSDSSIKTTDKIKGLVVIDEIDTHLHTNLQSNVLPKLIKLFPLVQFIVTTHSPLFILGMEKEFGKGGFEIRNMPFGEKISTESFSEFESVYKVFRDTKKFDDEIKNKIMENNRPIVFVEGSYDIKYIEKACELFNKKELFNKLKFIDGEGYCNLNNIWNHKSNLFNAITQNILLLYDCDTNIVDGEKGKIVRRIIPRVQKNILDRGIENLFAEQTIEKIIKYNSKFIDITEEYKKTVGGLTEKIPKKYEINKDAKGNLCDWICDNGTMEDFKNFKKYLKFLKIF